MRYNPDNRDYEGIAKGTALIIGRPLVAYSTDYIVDSSVKYMH